MAKSLRNIPAEEFVRRLKDVTEKPDKRYAFFIGAGCSVTSGIPAAGPLVKDDWLRRLHAFKAPHRDDFDAWVKEEFSDYDRDNPAASYGAVMGRLFLNREDRQREVERLCDDSFPGFGYSVLARLMSRPGGCFNIVLTTNFDDMVQDALYLYAEARPLVIHHYSLAAYIRPTRTRPLVVKVHGDHRLSPLNTAQETDQMKDAIAQQVQNLLHDRGVIFIGYGGNDKGIKEMFEALPDEALPLGVYWVSGEAPHGAIRPWLLKRDAVWVERGDFDELMLLCQDVFGLPPPDQNRFDDVFKKCMETYHTLRKRVGSLSGAEPDAAALKEAVGRTDRTIPAHWMLVSEGNSLRQLAQTKAGKEADDLLARACRKYEAALKNKPDMHEALNNLGNILGEQAKTKTGKEADDLFARAYEKYEAALKIKPKMYEALCNWGATLSAQAKTKTGKQADDLLARAYEKYEAALKIKPDDHDTLNNWGNTLADQAKTKTGKQADDLIAKAYAKYEAALKIKPDKHEALCNWGTTLSAQAKTKTGKQAHDLFARAYEKYEAALKIKPEMYEALGNWGATLSAQAKTKTGKQADDLFARACNKYEAALKVKPDKYEALCNWGGALAEQAKTKTGKQADDLFAKAYAKYEAALKIKPDKYEALNNWGTTLSAQAKTKTGKQADDLFARACNKYEAALKIKPDCHEALGNWGNTLAEQAKIKTGKEADHLSAKAYAKYKAVLKVKPDDHQTLNNWAGALVFQASAKKGQQRSNVLARAKELAAKVEALSPGTGAYNLACIAALHGEEKECRKWLKTSREHGKLPARDHLEGDTDLDSVRDKKWFKDLLASL